MAIEDYDLALRLGPKPRLRPEEALAQKIRLVLETQVGVMPYDQDFGTDLEGLVGLVADASRVTEARIRITSALSRFLPGVAITSVDARIVDFEAVGGDNRQVPTAERVMASEAISGTLQVSITVMSESGPIEIDATFD